MPLPESQKRLNDLEDLLRKSPDLEKRLPAKPEEPLPQDCCGQSCTPCVFDIHRDALDDWSKRCMRIIQHGDDSDPNLLDKVANPTVFSLQTSGYQTLKLQSITPMTSDTNLYRFALPSMNHRLFLPIGNHLIMKATGRASDNSTSHVVQLPCSVRQYTPITDADAAGYIDLMIKIYQNGKMSDILRQYGRDFAQGMEVTAEFRGPFGLFTYERNRYSDILMLAAGTGLAPMAQVIDHILKDEREQTRIRLLYCCRRYEDLLLKDRLDSWRQSWNFSSSYVLSVWREETDRRLAKYGEDIVTGGRIDQQRIKDEVQRLHRFEQMQQDRSGPTDSGAQATFGQPYQVLVCGTKSFEKDMINYLLKAGVAAKRIFRF